MKAAQSCLTLCDPMDYSAWNSPGQITGVGGLSLLQGIFPTQESNQGPELQGDSVSTELWGKPQIEASKRTKPQEETAVLTGFQSLYSNYVTVKLHWAS